MALQPGLDLLHGLVAGQRAERVHVVLAVQQRPQPLGAQPGQRVLLLDRAAQPDHVGGGVGPLGSRPARVSCPALLQARQTCASKSLPASACALEATIVHWTS